MLGGWVQSMFCRMKSKIGLYTHILVLLVLTSARRIRNPSAAGQRQQTRANLSVEVPPARREMLFQYAGTLRTRLVGTRGRV